MNFLSAKQIKQHSDSSSCWIVIHGKVYDLTQFLPEHPGGRNVILQYAGADATQAFDSIHPPGIINEYLPPEHHKGEVHPNQLDQLQIQPSQPVRKHDDLKLPTLSTCLSLYDFESLAKDRLSSQAWAYYSSGSDDEISLRENRAAFQRIWFRPRILRDVSRIDFSTTLLNSKTSMPIYITATALGKLGHPEGEKNLTWAAGEEDIIQMVPTLSSCSFDEIISSKKFNHQTQWLQIYVNENRTRTEEFIKKAELNGIRAFFITVDAPQLGRREKDMRLKFESIGSNMQDEDGSKIDKSQGASRAISSFIDSRLNWDDIPWFKKITKLPILLKGVQTWEDAVLAKEHGLQGVVLSNHGGRQLDFSRSGIEVLAEVVSELKKRCRWDPKDENFSIFIDGGIRRSGDIIKAICLGAKAVGIGRPFLYAYSVYGQPGVVRAIQILKEELEMNMRLIGAPTLNDLTPEMIDIRSLSNRMVDYIPDFKARQNYQALPQIKSSSKL